MKQKILLVLWCLCLALHFTACTSTPEKVETATPIPSAIPSPLSFVISTPTTAIPREWYSRWIKGIPCRAPCWEGITPGQTTAIEAVAILKRNPMVKTVETATSPLTPNQGEVTWTLLDNSKHSAYYLVKNPSQTIDSLNHSAFGTDFFKLREIIQTYGEPSHVLALRTSYGDTTKHVYNWTIIYLSQGFALRSGGLFGVDTSKDASFGGVTFFVPTMEGLNKILMGEARNHPEFVIPWQDNQPYDYYCRTTLGQPCRVE